MKASFVAALVAGSAAISGAGRPADQPPVAPRPLLITERWASQGSPEVMEFLGIGGMAEGPGGEVWVADGRLGQIGALDSLGRWLRVAARRGDGPGEFRGPSLIARRPEGGLAVYDAARMSVELLDARGRAERRVTLEHLLLNPKGLVVLRSGQFVMSGGFVGNPNGIHVFDREGKLLRSWHLAPTTRNPRAGAMVAGGPIAVLEDTLLLFSQAAPHEIIIYRLDGSVVRRVAAEKNLLPPIGDDFIQREVRDGVPVTSFRWYFPQSRAVFALDGARILNVVLFWDESKTLWELYSREGRLLDRVSVPQRYEPYLLATNGDILASYRKADPEDVVAARLRLQLP
jgi:hypothetical protein